ncbi:MAG: sigma 54-interacting transcriptional regulator [Erysipelotrichaceae bacterium]
MISTKKQIEEYLKTETKNISNQDFSSLTTSAICDALSISRSVTSQYLNEIFKKKQLIKINSRPVYFLDKKEYEEKVEVSSLDLEFYNLEDLLVTVSKQSNAKKDFMKAIGKDDSLNYCINQIKSALLYPDNGLPMILFGLKGSGKSYLVNLANEFLLNQNIFKSGTKVHKVKILNNTLSSNLLFGNDVNNEGLIEKAKDSLLYIEDANKLDEECQEKLAQYISTSTYQRGKDGKIYRSNARVILGITKNPVNCLVSNLIQNIPIICEIPLLNEREFEEKEAFVLKFFRQEAIKMHCQIRISNRLFETLLQMHFNYQIHELQKCIRTICANAFVPETDKYIDCYLFHLPAEQLNLIKIEVPDGEIDMLIDIQTYSGKDTSNRMIQLFDNIIDAYNEYQKNQISANEFLDKGMECMRTYYDYIVFKEQYLDSKVKAMEKLINEILVRKKHDNQINLPSNCGFVLARVASSIHRVNSKLRSWYRLRSTDIKECLMYLESEIYDEYIVSKDIAKQVLLSLDIDMSDMDIIFLMLNIHFYNQDLKSKEIVGIIVSHGYSTASSIADAANSMLTMHIFEAFDMPLDTSVEEIIHKVNDFVSLHPYYRNIVLMVDMGSLEGVGESIQGNANVGVINNISTGTAINIGFMINQKLELEAILQKACEDSKSRYKILTRAQKEQAIVFVSDAGIKVSERMSNLFKRSLPKSINLRFMPYDFNDLLKNGYKDALFEKYEVILMVNPYNLKINEINSVTLEDIVNFKDIKKVDDSLSQFLDRSEIEAFNHNLLKNFSLQNVMENLTILNANKLLDNISDAITNLQQLMNRKLQSKTIIGIYMHVCFLMERLVTKTAIDTYGDVKGFEEKEIEFIEDVNQSFKPMLDHYNVEIPISEIALLHDYIINDLKRGEDNEF